MSLKRWLQQRADRKLNQALLESYQRQWIAKELAEEHRRRLSDLRRKLTKENP